MNKSQGFWYDASGLALIATMLASTTLGACGPPYPISDPRLHKNVI
jgi:hypothetical protein